MKPRTSAVAAAGFAAFLNIYAIQALLPTLCQVFSAPRSQVGLLISATTLAVALLSPAAGLLGSRMSRHRKLWIAFSGLSLCGLAAALAADLSHMLIWRFAQGCFLPLLSSSILTWIGEDCEESQLARSLSVYITWTVVGGVCGRLTAGFLGYHLGWRPAMVVLALLTAAAAGVMLSRVPDKSPTPGQPPPDWRELLSLLAEPRLRAAFSSGFLVLFCTVGVFSYITYHLAAAPYSLRADQLGLLFLVYMVGTLVTPLAGRVMHRVGYETTFQASSLVGFLGLTLTLQSQLQTIMLGLALCAGSAFVSQSALSGFVTWRAGAQRSQAIGLYLSSYYLGGCVAGFAPGWLWNLGGWPACATGFAIAYLTCASFLTTALRQRPTGAAAKPI